MKRSGKTQLASAAESRGNRRNSGAGRSGLALAWSGAPGGGAVADVKSLLLAVLAAAVVTAGVELGWRGVDLPAQLYRIDLFHAHGFALWDSQWYGGHWLLDYSVLFPAIAASVGTGAVIVASAVAATVAFDRLVASHLSSTARAASVAFALGITVQSAIGQLTYLLGEAAGLWCLVLIVRRRWVSAALLGVVASLSSPLAAAFVGLAIAALMITGFSSALRFGDGPTSVLGRARRYLGRQAGLVSVAGALALPVVVTSLLFPGQGPMPYPVVDYLWEMAIALALLAACWRMGSTLRVGIALYAVALTVSVSVPSPMGGNIGRLEDCVALPLAVAGLWPARLPGRSRSGWRRYVLALMTVPLALSQWSPAWAAMTSNPAKPWTHPAYYQPVITFLGRHDVPAARVEVVPTADHWEAAYVAPVVALARGWERQLDLADNPIFYAPSELNASEYRAWLVDNGVRYVALPDAPLDEAARAEGALVSHGVPGLTLVWHDKHWRVFSVAGSSGIGGPGVEMLRTSGGQLTASIVAAGTFELRVRYSPAWRLVSGVGTVSVAPGRWIELQVPYPETVTLRTSVLG